jgi:hypothetical protein
VRRARANRRTRSVDAATVPLRFIAIICLRIAIGALPIGRVAIGRLAIKKARFQSLEVDELTVRKLRLIERESAPPIW